MLNTCEGEECLILDLIEREFMGYIDKRILSNPSIKLGAKFGGIDEDS